MSRGSFPSALVCLFVVSAVSVALAATASGRVLDQEAKTGAAKTVWDGAYTEEQAGRGQAQYKQSCAACHGQDLRGDNTAPSLIEESFAFLFDNMTLGELFGRIQAKMPPDRPNSLPGQRYCDVLAFLLQSNKFPAGGVELNAESDALDKIRITARPQAKPQ